jgi:RNA polymerase sigma factor (TIGR02999 family)
MAVPDDPGDNLPDGGAADPLPTTASYAASGLPRPSGDATQILSRIEQGDPSAAEELLPLVYHELRQLAAAQMSREKPGQTLQATALVHEAYLRLVGPESAQKWNSRRHFIAAAAEAMRRILVEKARRKGRAKHGGQAQHVALEEDDWITTTTPDRVLAVDESLARLAGEDRTAAEVLKLRYFAGMSVDEAARVLGIHRATAYRHWSYARAWVRADLKSDDQPPQ